MNNEKIKILIVDDHEIIHNGIRDILRNNERYEVCSSAFSGDEAIALCGEHHPDIVFMDISMPGKNGIETTQEIRSKFPDIEVIALTQHEDQAYVTSFFKAGGNGFLLKNSRKEQFFEAIENVLQGKPYLSGQLSGHFVQQMLVDSGPDQADEVHLTRREIEIIKKIADDKSNQEIADELNISVRTVETHRRNLMQKLGLKSVVALLKYAAQHRIINLG
ncbi:MAG: response regulator transcription factor [Bacteroidales bacterium]